MIQNKKWKKRTVSYFVRSYTHWVHFTYVQGDRMQTVKINLSLTDRRNTINFNLMADSVQGRLGIYAWMISKVPSWPLLASVTSNFTIHIFTWLFAQKCKKMQNSKLLFLWFDNFFDRFSYYTTPKPNIAPFWTVFSPFMAISGLLQKT